VVCHFPLAATVVLVLHVSVTSVSE
jgi:hypothetical protein